MSDIHAGPLPQASPDDEHHVGPLPRPGRYRKTEQERRWLRKRRRRVFEEVLGWILVPIILLACWWAAHATLAAFGTNFTALVQGIKLAISGRGGV